jgi:hypothetical protein
MKELYIDNKLIPEERIEQIKTKKGGVVVVVLVYHEKKERIITDSTITKIEIK